MKHLFKPSAVIPLVMKQATISLINRNLIMSIRTSVGSPIGDPKGSYSSHQRAMTRILIKQQRNCHFIHRTNLVSLETHQIVSI